MRRSILLLPFILSGFAIPALGAWPTNGAAVSTATNDQMIPAIASDDAAGAIIVWQDNRSTPPDIYARRVGPYGAVLWTANGVAVCSATGAQTQPAIAADGSGGAIIAWTDVRADNNADIYVQRLDASGTALWTANGVPLCTAANYQDLPAIVSDGAGGAIVAWTDTRNGGNQVFAARVNSAGVPQWTPNGISLTIYPSENARITTDGAGGAIVVWEDYHSFPNTDVYAQRINGTGTALWVADGVPVGGALNDQRAISIIPDGAGGAFLAWRDERGDIDIYSQHVNSSGVAQWAADGVGLSVFTFAPSNLPSLASDGAGGIIAAWEVNIDGGPDIRARRVNSSGTVLWTLGGVVVCNATFDQTRPQIVTDNLGGAVIVWQDGRSGGLDVYAQRINSSGVRQWAANGVAVCNATNTQQYPVIVSDGGNGAVMAWEDQRDAATTWRDIYAQRFGASGAIPTGVSGGTPDAAFSVGAAHPNPFARDTSVEITLRIASDVRVEVFDVAGRRVREFALREVPSGVRSVELNSLDARGRRLPGGVYFCQVTVGGSSQTQKLVIVK